MSTYEFPYEVTRHAKKKGSKEYYIKASIPGEDKVIVATAKKRNSGGYDLTLSGKVQSLLGVANRWMMARVESRMY